VRLAAATVIKNELRIVTRPASVVVGCAGPPDADAATATLRLDPVVAAAARRGDRLRFEDSRGRARCLTVRAVEPHGHLSCESDRRAYVLDRTGVSLLRGKRRIADGVFRVEGGAASIDVRSGDELVLTGRKCKGFAPRRDAAGRVTLRGLVSCTLPGALNRLDVGQRVLFDDGRIEAIVASAKKGSRDYVLRVVRTQTATVKLHAEKGINLPDTPLSMPALSPRTIGRRWPSSSSTPTP